MIIFIRKSITFCVRLYKQKYAQCAKKKWQHTERGWVVFTAKKEVTDCMSFPIEFKNLSITFFKKVDTRHDTPFWSYTQFLLNVICCYNYWMIDCSVILKLLLSTKKMNPCVDEWQPDLRSDTRQNGVPHAIEMQTKFP